MLIVMEGLVMCFLLLITCVVGITNGPVIVLVPFMVYYINGAVGFWDGFGQMTAILLMQGLFDRFFIDWYWVECTKAWEIPGTEDLSRIFL